MKRLEIKIISFLSNFTLLVIQGKYSMYIPVEKWLFDSMLRLCDFLFIEQITWKYYSRLWVFIGLCGKMNEYNRLNMRVI